MATRSSLGFIADATTVRLSDGSTNIVANNITTTNLQPSTTLKTDSARNIVSADLYLSDIKDYVPPGASVSNPMIENLDANGKNIENVGNLETTLINSRGILYNTSIANLNMGGFNINNSPTLTTLQDKTQYITADTKTGETIFNSSILLNGGNITNMNSILFDNGATIVADNQNLLLTSNNLITTTANIDTDFDIRCGTLTAVDISNSTFSNLVNKTQNITAVPNLTTFTGSTRVLSNTTVDGVSTLVGGITSNTKITLTKNIIEIQEDNVQTEAITIGNLATTGFSIPRTNGGIPGQELRLQSDNKLGWYSPSTYIRFFRNTTLGSVTLLTSPTATRISIFPLLITESTSPFPVFTTTASGAQYTPTESRKAFQMSFNCMATIATNPAGGEYVFRLIHRKAGPVEAVLSALRLVMNKDAQYPISLQAVGFDILQNDVLDVSIEGSLSSTIQLDSQQVSIIAH